MEGGSMACRYLRNGVWYLKFRRNGAPGWKSTGSASARVAEDFLRRVKRGEAVPELGILAEGSDGVGLRGEDGAPYGETISGDGVTIGGLVEAWLAWAEKYYVDDSGRATGELGAVRAAVAPLRARFGDLRVEEFGPKLLKVVREDMIALGWARSTVNAQCRRIVRCFRWGVENELVSGDLLLRVRAVAGLRRGRTVALESEPVKPVRDSDIDAVRPELSGVLRAMVDVQLFSGARPGEVVILRPCDIDRSGAVWVAAPSSHKTAYRGLRRTLYFGPRAQEVLRPFLVDRAEEDFLFVPREAEFATRRAGARYSSGSYRRAIARACERVNAKRVEEAAGGPVELIEVWSPNQLRHNTATLIRGKFGLDVAQVVLGHAKADVTQVYADVDRVKAMAAVEEVG